VRGKLGGDTERRAHCPSKPDGRDPPADDFWLSRAVHVRCPKGVGYPARARRNLPDGIELTKIPRLMSSSTFWATPPREASITETT
jgi:hypothetical protein